MEGEGRVGAGGRARRPSGGPYGERPGLHVCDAERYSDGAERHALALGREEILRVLGRRARLRLVREGEGAGEVCARRCPGAHRELDLVSHVVDGWKLSELLQRTGDPS